MESIIYLLAVFGLQFLITQSNGPFNSISNMRNWLIRNKYYGVFFYKLLSCSFCSGCWAGLIIYLLIIIKFNFCLWFFAGGSICLIIDALLLKLHQ